MSEEGVNGLSLSEVARRLGVQPPSIYKYFPSLMAIYDELFLRGQSVHLDVMRDAMATADPVGSMRSLPASRRAGAGCWPTARWPNCCSGALCRGSNPHPGRWPSARR